MNTPTKFTILAIFCSVSSLLPAAEVRSSRNTNPALLYWQAAAELPSLDDTQAKQLREVADGRVEVREEFIEDLNFVRSLQFLRKAVDSEAPCQWGLAWEEGIGMSTPHLAKMREFSTIVLVLAEAKFAKDEVAGGIDLLLVAHHIARDAGVTPFLISNIIQNVLERRTIATAARHCMGWDAATRADYARRQSELPGLSPLHEAFASELEWIGHWERELVENFDQAREKLGLAAGSAKSDSLQDPKLIAEMIATYRKVHAKGMASLKLEGEARRVAVAGFEKHVKMDVAANKAMAGNILVAIAMPTLIGIVRGEDQTSIARAMLKSALEHGPEISGKDLEGRTFELVRKDDGLELNSKELEFTLRFGK